jgi:hypothetical protein
LPTEEDDDGRCWARLRLGFAGRRDGPERAQERKKNKETIFLFMFSSFERIFFWLFATLNYSNFFEIYENIQWPSAHN